LDPFIFVLITLSIATISGYISGFMVVQINHLLVILLGKINSGGHAQKRYIPTGVAACAIYLTIMLFFLFPNENVVIKFASLPFFIGLYVFGITRAKRLFKQTHKILFELIKIMYYSPTDKKLDDNTIKDTMKTADSILSSMPQSNKEALMILLLFFNSTTTVFLVSLISGRIRLKSFINLNTIEKTDYLQAWAQNKFLFYAIQGMKSLVSFSYFANSQSWSAIGYNGELLRRSYLD